MSANFPYERNRVPTCLCKAVAAGRNATKPHHSSLYRNCWRQALARSMHYIICCCVVCCVLCWLFPKNPPHPRSPPLSPSSSSSSSLFSSFSCFILPFICVCLLMKRCERVSWYGRAGVVVYFISISMSTWWWIECVYTFIYRNNKTNGIISVCKFSSVWVKRAPNTPSTYHLAKWYIWLWSTCRLFSIICTTTRYTHKRNRERISPKRGQRMKICGEILTKHRVSVRWLYSHEWKNRQSLEWNVELFIKRPIPIEDLFVRSQLLDETSSVFCLCVISCSNMRKRMACDWYASRWLCWLISFGMEIHAKHTFTYRFSVIPGFVCGRWVSTWAVPSLYLLNVVVVIVVDVDDCGQGNYRHWKSLKTITLTRCGRFEEFNYLN